MSSERRLMLEECGMLATIASEAAESVVDERDTVDLIHTRQVRSWERWGQRWSA